MKRKIGNETIKKDKGHIIKTNRQKEKIKK
jgi:hypothetical protein